MWLIPLVWGWFAVGTHHGRRTDVIREIQERLELITGSTPDAPVQPIDSTDMTIEIKYFPITRFTVQGDALLDGPFYNYSRCVSWTSVSKTMIDAYRESVSMPPTSDLPDVTPGIRSSGETFFDRNAGQMDTIELGLIGENTTRKRRVDLLTARQVRAFVFAAILHAVFGWSAFMIDYTTPTIGIGCRAFICATYTLLSLFSCILLAVASSISDHLMFGPRKNRRSRMWGITAIAMRLLGKALAVLNGMFIILACILEFIGVYQSCFCRSDYLSLRGRAFISFLSPQEAARVARPFWYVGSGVAIITVLVVCFGYFSMLNRKVKTK